MNSNEVKREETIMPLKTIPNTGIDGTLDAIARTSITAPIPVKKLVVTIPA